MIAIYIILGIVFIGSFLYIIVESENKIRTIILWTLFFSLYCCVIYYDFNVQNSVTEKTFKVETVNNIDVIVSGNDIINLNARFGRDFEEGQEVIEVTTIKPSRFSGDFANTQYKVKE